MLVNLCLLLIFSNGHISKFAIRLLETEIIPKNDLTAKYDYGIVLGGFSTYFPLNKRIQFNSSADRILQTIDLYKSGIIDKIIVSGGSGRLLNQHEKESEYVLKYLINIGIDEDDLLIENLSRNTLENARYTAALYGNDTLSYLLITSAIHMKRAENSFKKYFNNIGIYPVNFFNDPERKKGSFWKGFIPSAGAMQSWQIILHECIGRMYYKLKSRN